MILTNNRQVSIGKSVIAVVVTYNPVLLELQCQLEALVPQVQAVVIVDNASKENIAVWNSGLTTCAQEVILLDENYGVGAAHNRGIAWAKLMGACFVLLMDQDSVPEPDMVTALVSAYEKVSLKGHQVGAVGSQYLQQGALSGFFIYSVPREERIVHSPVGVSAVECEILISSGTLIPVAVLDEVGCMDEALFIDYVDVEWCLRAVSKGYMLFGATGAIMSHHLGSELAAFWLLGFRQVPVHHSSRYYYMVRNSLLLLKRRYPPLAWKRYELGRLFRLFLVFGLCVPERYKRLFMMMKGLLDGLVGRIGK